jgi:hypothetical protein
VLLLVLPSLAKATESLAMEPDKLESAPPIYLPYFIFQPLLPFMNGDFESGPAYWTADVTVQSGKEKSDWRERGSKEGAGKPRIWA